MTKDLWKISGYNGTETIFEDSVPAYLFSEKQMEEVIRRLVCQHLTSNEIVSASKNRAKQRSELLLVQKVNTTGSAILTCGTNPYYVAKFVSV